MTPFPPSTLPLAVNAWVAARLLPLFASSAPIDRVLALATPPQGARAYGDFAPQAIADIAKRAARRPWVMREQRCLREGILAFRYLALAGHKPLLHFAIEKTSLGQPVPKAHCWVTVGGKILINPPTPTMIDMFAWDGAVLIKPQDLARRA
jgi:hypothetical protein